MSAPAGSAIATLAAPSVGDAETASQDKTARVWDAETGKPLGAPMTHEKGVASASFSPDGKRVVTASSDKSARVWDAETGKPLGAPMTHDAQVNSASFSPDGKRVVTASQDQSARVWRADWSLFESTDALMVAACASIDPAARRITVEDRRLVPLIPPKLLGQDVCELAGSVPSR